MTLDWHAFTPWSALAGGLLIGLAAALLWLLNGRIAGISGIVGGLMQGTPGAENAWRLAFVVGLLLAPWLYRGSVGLPPIHIQADTPMLIGAGLLVGYGTRLGSGCTSGHGVCGLSRFSPRSMAATVLFMAAGFATVFLVRHVLGA